MLELIGSGTTIKNVATKFRISQTRVGQIIATGQRLAERQVRRDNLREEMRLADDLDRQWDLNDLLCAMNFPTRVDTALRVTKGYFTGFKGDLRARISLDKQGVSGDVPKMSLRELMDLLLNDVPSYSDIELTRCRLLMLHSVGKYGLRDTISAISSFNLGEKCNQEWGRRMEGLRAIGLA